MERLETMLCVCFTEAAFCRKDFEVAIWEGSYSATLSTLQPGRQSRQIGSTFNYTTSSRAENCSVTTASTQAMIISHQTNQSLEQRVKLGV